MLATQIARRLVVAAHQGLHCELRRRSVKTFFFTLAHVRFVLGQQHVRKVHSLVGLRLLGRLRCHLIVENGSLEHRLDLDCVLVAHAARLGDDFLDSGFHFAFRSLSSSTSLLGIANRAAIQTHLVGGSRLVRAGLAQRILIILGLPIGLLHPQVVTRAAHLQIIISVLLGRDERFFGDFALQALRVNANAASNVSVVRSRVAGYFMNLANVARALACVNLLLIVALLQLVEVAEFLVLFRRVGMVVAQRGPVTVAT